MPKDYKTIFVATESTTPAKMYKNYIQIVNGVILARDTSAALNEMSAMGYEFVSSNPIQSTEYHNRFYTEGLLMIFAKEIEA